MSTEATLEKPVKTRTKARKTRTVRASLWALLQELFSQHRSFEGITAEVAERFPKAKFNLARNTRSHYLFYRSKYNRWAKEHRAGQTTSSLPEGSHTRKGK